MSIGLVAPNDEFYAELDRPSLARLAGIRRNRFLQATVLPQFGRVAHAEARLHDMAHMTASWLRAQEPEALPIAYDYSIDYELLEELLQLVDPGLVPQLEPVHVGYLLEDPDGIAAAEAAWIATEARYGLGRHHALADALALMARFEAVHGSSRTR
ncbi:hypothetical protein [Variovorax sp. Sphag1AA]|uniref:hypothetical protein n=1 Tax=Variovorax sp. Sphag1AA TaxID=2587027 RepID=UPI0016100135|nr:hypothetical protein [Variovorax sp. Sphag1AA]MBB3182274.1 hypothetical protein [Variovorax sp. Sphag1AA]